MGARVLQPAQPVESGVGEGEGGAEAHLAALWSLMGGAELLGRWEQENPAPEPFPGHAAAPTESAREARRALAREAPRVPGHLGLNGPECDVLMDVVGMDRG